MRKVSKEISLMITAAAAGAVLLLTAVILPVGAGSAVGNTERSLTELAAVSADRIGAELRTLLTAAEETGRNPVLYSAAAPNETKQSFLDGIAEEHGFSAARFINADGEASDGGNRFGEEYFTEAMNGRPSVFISADGRALAAAPVRNGSGEAVGCVCFETKDGFFDGMLENSGSAFITFIADGEGNPIASSMPEKEIGCAGAVGEGLRGIKISGRDGYAAFSPIDGAEGRFAAAAAEKSEAMSGFGNTVLWAVLVSAAEIILISLLSLKLGERAGKPIDAAAERLEALVRGDLAPALPEGENGGAAASLTETAEVLSGNLYTIINDTARMLSAMSEGNFNIDAEPNRGAYRGGYGVLLDSAEKLSASLSDSLSAINASAIQVSGDSGQVSKGARTFAQDAAEQAVSVDGLAETVAGVIAEMNGSGGRCAESRLLAEETAGLINEAVFGMDELTAAMNEINSSSAEAGSIAETVREISRRANLAAMTAAVEASKAGEYGRELAEAAEEVREIALMSAKTAESAAALIGNSAAAAGRGAELTARASAAVRNAAEHAENASRTANEIAEAEKTRAEMLDRVSEGVSRISEVLRSGTEAAGESAAASEALSGEAESLRVMVELFRFRNN